MYINCSDAVHISRHSAGSAQHFKVDPKVQFYQTQLETRILQGRDLSQTFGVTGKIIMVTIIFLKKFQKDP